MKCPRCGTEMSWMGNVMVNIKNAEKHYRKLTKRAFRDKDVQLLSADWEKGLYCPNYLVCGNVPKERR